jgi:vancomycin resistance protein YoaR
VSAKAPARLFVNGYDITGLSRTEAEQKLTENFNETLRNAKVKITHNKTVYTYGLSEFGLYTDFSPILDIIFAEKKSRKKIKTTLDITYVPVVKWEQETAADKIQQITGTVSEAVNRPAVDATAKMVSGIYAVTASETGRKVSETKLHADILDILSSINTGMPVKDVFEIRLLVESVAPKVTEDAFVGANERIGTYTTYFLASQDGTLSNREINILNAASKINNYIVYPNEIFSTNKAFGETTEANGYVPAPIITNGKMVDGMGGGQCQVSSTLYCAVLYAELPIVERQNHSLKVSYIDYGFDATLAGEYIDLKFKNDTDTPILIEAIHHQNSLTINIYGREIRPYNRQIEFVSELRETIEPDIPVYNEDPSLPKGFSEVIKQERNGFKYDVYKIIYINGYEVGNEHINTSFYRPVKGEYRVGPK